MAESTVSASGAFGMSATMKEAATSASPGLPTIATRSNRFALGVSLLIWAIMLAATLTLVARFGSNVPTWDDWDLVPTATGQRPVTPEWLWSQHNEHRIPLPRLLLLAMMRWSGMDFRTGMYFNVVAASVLALGMIFTARRIRGSSSYLDAFFPVALMNWGQAVNFLWCWQVQYFASTLLAGGVLILIARAATPPKLLPALAAGGCVVLLPLCGANGLGLVPALALWLTYVAFLHWRAGTTLGRRNAVIVAAFVAGALLLAGLYFAGYARMPYVPLTRSLPLIGRAAAQFLTLGLGPGAVGLSFDRHALIFFWKIVYAAVVGLYLASAWVLLKTWWMQPGERARSAGLFLFLGAITSLALGVGMSRDAFETRYVTLSVPGFCAVYLVWTLYGARRFQNIVKPMLLMVTLAVFTSNMSWGWRWAHYLRSHLAEFERDIRAGTPPYQLLHRSADLHQDQELMMDYMPMLRAADVGVFRYLRDDPPFLEVSMPFRPSEIHNMTWEGGIAHATASDAWLTFTLPRDIQAAGIRLDYTYSNTNGNEPYLGISWKSSDEADFGKDSHIRYYPVGDRGNWRRGTWRRQDDTITTLHAWICQPVQTVRLLVIEPATIRIHNLTLLVPAEAGRRH